MRLSDHDQMSKLYPRDTLSNPMAVNTVAQVSTLGSKSFIVDLPSFILTSIPSTELVNEFKLCGSASWSRVVRGRVGVDVWQWDRKHNLTKTNTLSQFVQNPVG